MTRSDSFQNDVEYAKEWCNKTLLEKSNKNDWILGPIVHELTADSAQQRDRVRVVAWARYVEDVHPDHIIRVLQGLHRLHDGRYYDKMGLDVIDRSREDHDEVQ